MSTTSFQLDPDDLEDLKQTARRLSLERAEPVSVGSILRELVREYLASTAGGETN